MPHLHIRSAQRDDVALIIGFIRELADYEKLSDQVVVDPAQMSEHLFGAHPFAEVLIGEVDGTAAGFADEFFIGQAHVDPEFYDAGQILLPQVGFVIGAQPLAE